MKILQTPEKINTIIFDVGHTLLFPDAGFLFQLASPFIKLNEQEFQRIGAITKEKAYRQEPRNPFKLWFSQWMLQAGVRSEDLPGLLLGIQKRHAEKHLWSMPEPDVPQILIDLRDAQYKLGIISNSDGSVGPLLEEFGFDTYFECILDSGVIGIEKPDARIFLMDLEKMHSSPEESLYVGDHVLFDIKAAQSVGMQAVLIDPFDVVSDSPAPKIQRLSQLKSILQ